ncbi:hypothetical protein E2I00_014687 [Balaenoptera physalus]|uniref:Uncharacterized protein n=1 Tax=Balaenoptera physalus TaxID=9770 RepID=A0A643BWZ2_BALPH|nr:hypothetical protein E2I00_014687 [Balaenoptera physalus]
MYDMMEDILSHSKFVVVRSTANTSCLDVNASHIMKTISITAVNEMNEPIDEIIFHVVGLKCIFRGVQRIKINVDIGLGSKKVVFRFRSVNSMVIPAARTGKDNRSNTAVIRTDHMNSGVWYWVIAGGFMLIIVVIKLMAQRIEDTPAKCREKIVRSTEAPACAKFPAKGGYTVQPVPAPAFITNAWAVTTTL